MEVVPMIKRIKQYLLIALLSMSYSAVSQESYNLCGQALELCPGDAYAVNNIGATSTFCPNCEDDFNFCFSGENTIWFYFQTNATGGDVQLFFSNLVFEANPGQGNALQAAVIATLNPCIASSYTLASNCTANETTDFVLTAPALQPETIYYVVVNGALGTTSHAEASFDLTVNGPGIMRNPTLTIGSSAGDVCIGETVTFTATIQGCDLQGGVSWYADDVLIGSTSGNTLITSALTASTTITAEVDCFENCTETLVSPPLPINVVSFPVDAGPDFEIVAGESVQLEGFTTESDYEWSPPLFMNNPNILNPIVNPTQTTIYYLSANNGVCTITDYMEVRVISALEIPNTFSPNGDGVNDTWEIPGIELYPDCYIQVFDRWGQLVFQTNGYPASKRWDGTRNGNGRPLAPSSYYYVINLRTEDFPEPIKGFVSIVR